MLGLPRPLPGRFQDGNIFRESLPLNKDNLCNHDIPIIGSCLAAEKLFLHLNIPYCNFYAMNIYWAVLLQFLGDEHIKWFYIVAATP